ncbi:MAG: threonine synthase [Pseudomonadota bacterium]
MLFHSHKDDTLKARFSDALLASLAPDGGLWMPDAFPSFSETERQDLSKAPFSAVAARLARHFMDDRFSDDDVQEICADAYDFDPPIRGVASRAEIGGAAAAANERDYVLELFHGPTLAFKDYAARFMARSASRLIARSGAERTILVATSGDTGGAVGAAFAGQPGVRVFILFPKDGVSRIQAAQLTTIGVKEGNVRALAVDGAFDDCQALVKAAFSDPALNEKHGLMSANSINVGRVTPQSFYYFWASLKLKAAHPDLPLTISVPSGNLGNVTGGLMARVMGAPIDRFVVGHNVNDPFVEYLTTGVYRPRPSVPTLSNAMDVGRPNNFERILTLFDNDVDAVRRVCWGARFTDEETGAHLKSVYDETGYLMCPHTAVGHAAASAHRKETGGEGVYLTVGTAHPAKFADGVEPIIGAPVPLPPALADALAAKPAETPMKPELSALAAVLDGAS